MKGADLIDVLRQLEAAHPTQPGLGRARLPLDEPVRLGQPPHWTFSPPVVTAVRQVGAVTHVDQLAFGLLGIHGPLPLWMTEQAANQERHVPQSALRPFLDLLIHRLGLLLYRAWMQTQVHAPAHRNGPRDWCDHLTGRWLPPAPQRGLATPAPTSSPTTPAAMSRLSTQAHRLFAGRLWRRLRDAEGLRRWLAHGLSVPVRVHCRQGAWMPLPLFVQSRLLNASATACRSSLLGGGAVLGQAVWDVQHRIRVVLGPLTADRYQQLQIDGEHFPRLRHWLDAWLASRWQCDVQLILAQEDRPELRLQGQRRLGRDSWLHADRSGDADELMITDASAKPRRASGEVT